MRILIDPGHGGRFTGAIAAGVMEKDVNLLVAIELKRMLNDLGHDVHMTRTEDRDFGLGYVGGSALNVDLNYRCDMERTLRPDLTISLHCNSFHDERAHGFEVFTSPGETKSDKIATTLIECFHRHFPLKKIRRDWTDGDPDKEAHFRVLVGTAGPAVLVELAFLSNDKDREWIASEDGQYKAAASLAVGIQEYLTRWES